MLTIKQLEELQNILKDYTPYSITDCKNLSEFIYLNTPLYSEVVEGEDSPQIKVQGYIPNLFGIDEQYIEMENDLTFSGYNDLLEKLDGYIQKIENYKKLNAEFLLLKK